MATLIILWIVRVGGIAQLALGGLFWTGHAYQYVPLHISIGFLVVLCLWALALVALFRRISRGLAAFALIWGLALPALGMPQATILVGPMHWIIRVIHLLMGLWAVGLAHRLGASILAAGPVPVREGQDPRTAQIGTAS